MMKMIALAVIAATACSSTFARDGDEALFGLRWGMSPAEVKSLGVTISKTEGDRNLETYRTASLPKNISDTEWYSMIFADGKLVKIKAVSKDISADPTGKNGKERFEFLRSALVEKYGKPTLNYQSTGNKLYKEWDEFYQCLAYSGCGMWASAFETQDKSVVLELEGLRRATGYITIAAEAKPQWSQALDIYKLRKSNSDKSAL